MSLVIVARGCARVAFSAGMALALWGCAGMAGAPGGPSASSASSTPSGLHTPAQGDLVAGPAALAWVAGEQWSRHSFPHKKPTDFQAVQQDGRHAVRAVADASASMLRQKIRIEPADLAQLSFSWKVPQLIASADMALREGEDSPVRIVLAFEGDSSKLSLKNQMFSELAHSLTGEPLPYATLMYVWCNKRAAGTLITNPRSDRVRKIVVEQGITYLNQWLDYERDIKADFERAFGEAPGALIGVALMTDSDNTKTRTQAWYGPVTIGKLGKAPAP